MLNALSLPFSPRRHAQRPHPRSLPPGHPAAVDAFASIEQHTRTLGGWLGSQPKPPWPSFRMESLLACPFLGACTGGSSCLWCSVASTLFFYQADFLVRQTGKLLPVSSIRESPKHMVKVILRNTHRQQLCNWVHSTRPTRSGDTTVVMMPPVQRIDCCMGVCMDQAAEDWCMGVCMEQAEEGGRVHLNPSPTKKTAVLKPTSKSKQKRVAASTKSFANQTNCSP